jgi:nicotinamidase-related amidase
MAVWDKFLTAQDKLVLAASGYGTKAGFGSRPAVLIIDVNYAFVGDRRQPILESVKTWHNSCGEAGWDAIPRIQELLAAARANRIPVIYTNAIDFRQDGFDSGAWNYKTNRMHEDYPEHMRAMPVNGTDLVREIAPQPHELVVRKLKASGFVGTPLLGFLIDLGVDNLIVGGVSTSGCVRATVVDAVSQNFRVSVVEECTFDRFESSHAMSLFDMQAKYCDVVPLAEAVAYLRETPAGLYDDKIAFPREPAAAR